MKSRQFSSFEDAIKYLEAAGSLTYFGRAGLNFEYCVYTLTLPDGRKFRVDVYDNGKVITWQV